MRAATSVFPTLLFPQQHKNFPSLKNENGTSRLRIFGAGDCGMRKNIIQIGCGIVLKG